MLPACAGVIPMLAILSAAASDAPRMRGGDPSET